MTTSYAGMSADAIVAALLPAMTREEKAAQVAALWLTVDPARGEVAPYQSRLLDTTSADQPVAERLRQGIGQFTRPFGSTPLDPALGVRTVNALQRTLIEQTRLGIPAIVHEECLTGFMAHGATAFPAPLNWGSCWDPALVEQIGAAIRASMRSVGAHQGLAPVLDVVRDARWGRVEECIAEDPLLVGVTGAAYIRGLQGDLRHGVAATAKHFAGYSASEGGRNLAPAHIGPRELEDVFLVPYVFAVREAGVRTIMHAYQEIDGVPVAASRELLTGVLRDRWGFDGVVVADYFGVAFLHALHGVAEGPPEAAALALSAGLDLELPARDCYGAPLLEALDRGLIDESLLDRSVERVLRLKAQLGLFDEPYIDETSAIDLDPPPHRALARRVAERSLVLLKNDGVLPLDPARLQRVALIGPNAADGRALLGNYTFQQHVAYSFPHAPAGPPLISVAAGLRAALLSHVEIEQARGCDVTGGDDTGFAAAVAAANAAEVAIVVVGDRAGHFGRGTVGEGSDADDLTLPGLQQQLIAAVAATGTPVVLVLVEGRPHALGAIVERAAAIVEAWFPGEEGGAAIARLLTGAVEPVGRLPLTVPASAGVEPLSYLTRRLGRGAFGRRTYAPVFAFGHGLSYTRFAYDDLAIDPPDARTDGELTISFSLRNAGVRAGEELVQLYVRDRAGSVTRPLQELKGFVRVPLAPGETARVAFTLPPEALAFTGLDMTRAVEPGAFEAQIGASSLDIRLRQNFSLSGEKQPAGLDAARLATASATSAGSSVNR